ncbi:hypothetical protein PR202_gb13808 [Eleusine coracana subsp. coracana]|uniref:Uncharacterized protein n=1 Tax=Eleusine coracana subsp. coracana TaxID=191504 RepID=A0AAV5ESX3_ELECO|nr:hypothetical protein PR202_gb13808 [Eleusine coracana subsp. coracana]
MAAAAAAITVLPAWKRGRQQLGLGSGEVGTTKTKQPPVLTRRSVSVRAAPPRQQQRSRARQRPPPPPPPPRRQPPRGRARPPAPLDHDDHDDEEEESRFAGGTRAASMPKPPAGFVLDDQGRCIAAASKRIVTIIDDTNNRPLECIIRRVFRSSQDHECMLLCPVDMYPSFSFLLLCLYLFYIQFCYTARGGFCFPEEAIQEFHDSGDGGDGVPFEGVEICCFNLDGSHYMIYTPVDPLLFIAVKDNDGVLRIAEDDLMDDPAIVSAIDEETEFTALVEEEEALLETVLGER